MPVKIQPTPQLITPDVGTQVHQSFMPLRLIAAFAPADAKSCRALMLRVTRGRLEALAAMPGPVLRRLLPVELLNPLTVDCRRPAAIRTGLAPLASRPLTAVPFLKLVAGGSGSGRMLADGVVMVLFLLIGDSFRGVIRTVGIDDFCPVRNSCRTASSGFIRRSGSHRRHLDKKSRNGSSSHFSA